MQRIKVAATQLVIWNPTFQDVVDDDEDAVSYCDNRALPATTTGDAVVEGAQVRVLGTRCRPGYLDQNRAEPLVPVVGVSGLFFPALSLLPEQMPAHDEM